MFSRTKSLSEIKLEAEITRVLQAMKSVEPGKPEYTKLLSTLDHLQKMRENEIPASVSKDTRALIAANLAGILLIIRAEHVNVLSQRALNLLMRTR